MRLLLIGATGRTGRHLMNQALERGHDVTALVRDPARLTTTHPRLAVRVGSLTDPAVLDAAMKDQDAVLSTIGSSSPRELLGTDLMRTSVRSLADAMRRAGVRRIVLLSALGVGRSAHSAPLPLRLTFATLFRSIGKDKAASEDVLRDRGLDWTVVYPPQLTDGPLTTRYQHGRETRVRGMPKVSRADVADLMLGLLDDPESLQQAIVVTSP